MTRRTAGTVHRAGTVRTRALSRVGLALGCLLLLVAGGSPARASAADEQHLHVDCGAPPGGDGSLAQPWNSLEEANQAQLLPGDELLLRRGTVCTGMLAPAGSGTAVDPVVIGAYGDGPLPRIDANGVTPAAVHLDDVPHVVVQDLELTNSGDATDRHRGVYITATNSAVGDVTVRRLFVHHVDGPVAFTHHDKLGGGIIVENLGSAAEARLDGVLIEDNRIEDVARSGIFMDGGPGTPRPRASEPWPEAATGIVVRNNTLTRLAGDGIVPVGTVGAIVEDNVVSVGNLSGKNFLDPVNRNCSAGIWTFNANRTLIQRNEVFAMRFGQSSNDGCDGTGFDIDYNQDGTIIQFNYSHDNEGGFVLLCSDDQPRTGEVRFNLSVDDAHTFSAAPCKAPDIGGFDGLRFHNNTFVAPNPNVSGENLQQPPVLYNAGSFEFRNNIVYATATTVLPLACGDHCTNNLFFNITPSGTNTVTADPLFEDSARRGEDRLQVGQGFRLLPSSPAIGAGTPIPGTSQTDYFGAAVPIDRAPAIGFHQPPVPSVETAPGVLTAPSAAEGVGGGTGSQLPATGMTPGRLLLSFVLATAGLGGRVMLLQRSLRDP